MAGKHGGAREGAGRPAKPDKLIEANGDEDSLEFLRLVVRDNTVDVQTRTRAAIALAQYEHTRLSDGGKKDGRKRAAEEVAGSKFGASAPPKLAVVKTV